MQTTTTNNNRKPAHSTQVHSLSLCCSLSHTKTKEIENILGYLYNNNNNTTTRRTRAQHAAKQTNATHHHSDHHHHHIVSLTNTQYIAHHNSTPRRIVSHTPPVSAIHSARLAARER